MEEIVTILSTREWAIAIWGTGFFVWMLTQREIRKSLWNVIKILLGKKLRHFFLIIALYVAGITMIFYQLPFWNNIYLKDIILWLIFSGISYCVNSIIKGDAEHLKSTVKDNFRVIVIFEYFIGTFTFKFWIEMLIIPVITILTLMNVVAESEEKYRGVHKLIDIVLACIGWYMLWGAANVGLKEYKELNAINTLVSFMIPIVYTILILPLEFGLEIYSDYEQVFVRMKFRDNQDKKIQRKHRWRVIRTCKLSLRKILLFRKEYVNRMYGLMSEETFGNILSERLEVDGEHLEKRVADYCDKIPDTVQLIKLGRKWRGCRVVCENPNRSFLRVLYKDWYNHKFDWEETELGRIVLSASEPYCLLITPQLWTYNNGYLLNPPESFISSSSVEQKKQIHDILFEGVDDTETVLAGGIIDYTHKEEIFGFMVSYFSIPGLPSKYAAHCYERNSRLLLQSRPDFSEQEHYNITLHHNGIESFQGSNIMCGFSKISLDEFHWHINITVNGMRLFNEGGQEIGRFEYYYGQRGNMGNRYISNQPLLQRWVVSKDAISKARCIVGCPNNIKINHAFDSVIRKYED